MSKMKEVAKLLKVEIGEEFKLKGTNKICKITEDGLKDISLGMDSSYILERLLVGEAEVEKMIFKPKYGEEFWSAYKFKNSEYLTENIIWTDYMTDFFRYKMGLVFKTKEEAEEIGIPKLKKIIEEYENE